MKNYFLYVPLIYFGYALIKSEEDLRRFFSFVLALSLIVAAFGARTINHRADFPESRHLQEGHPRTRHALPRVTHHGLVAYRPTSVRQCGRFPGLSGWLPGGISLFSAVIFFSKPRGRTLACTTSVCWYTSLMMASSAVFL